MIAILIETAAGSYLWDCAALLTPHLVAHLKSLDTPLKGIAISHPHVRSFATFLLSPSTPSLSRPV